jgi:hypothetical protein
MGSLTVTLVGAVVVFHEIHAIRILPAVFALAKVALNEVNEEPETEGICSF